jgi:K+ transporter
MSPCVGAAIGKIFGRVMTLWFAWIATLGFGQIFQEPRVWMWPLWVTVFFAFDLSYFGTNLVIA